jgi:hypothetical protein
VSALSVTLSVALSVALSVTLSVTRSVALSMPLSVALASGCSSPALPSRPPPAAKAPDAPGAAQPPGAVEAARQGEVAGVPLASLRCTLEAPTEHVGAAHLACPGMLPSHVSIRNHWPPSLGYRLLGPVHFLEGTLAAGAPFARTVVAIRPPPPANARDARFAGALARAIARHAARSDGRVRVVLGDDPDATTRVELAVDRVKMGAVEPLADEPPGTGARVSRSATALLELQVDAPPDSRRRSRWVEARETAPVQPGDAPGPLDSVESMLTPLAASLVNALDEEMPALLAEADEDRALRALAQAHRQPPPLGYERLEAIALDVAGARLGEPIARGVAAPGSVVLRTAPRSKGGSSGPSAQSVSPEALSRPPCLVAVALADPPSARMWISTASGTHRDDRGFRHAVVEICEGEAGAAPAQGLLLHLESGGARGVRWALFEASWSAQARATP